MADFTVVVASGAIVQDWLDPPTASGTPSRLNPRPSYRHKRWVGARGVQVILKAVVAGVVAPLDSVLGGRLFAAWPVEAPAQPFAGILQVPGFSSTIYVLPPVAGHYTIGVRRPSGGLEHVHLDIA
jgi:hypothetical protein